MARSDQRPATVPRREIATWQGFDGWMQLQPSTLAFFFLFPSAGFKIPSMHLFFLWCVGSQTSGMVPPPVEGKRKKS
jgi:hypothetical protein